MRREVTKTLGSICLIEMNVPKGLVGMRTIFGKNSSGRLGWLKRNQEVYV